MTVPSCPPLQWENEHQNEGKKAQTQNHLCKWAARLQCVSWLLQEFSQKYRFYSRRKKTRGKHRDGVMFAIAGRFSWQCQNRFLSHSYAVDASFMFCSRWLFLHYNKDPRKLQNSTTENLTKTLLKYTQPVQRKWNGRKRLLEEKRAKKKAFQNDRHPFVS